MSFSFFFLSFFLPLRFLFGGASTIHKTQVITIVLDQSIDKNQCKKYDHVNHWEEHVGGWLYPGGSWGFELHVPQQKFVLQQRALARDYWWCNFLRSCRAERAIWVHRNVTVAGSRSALSQVFVSQNMVSPSLSLVPSGTFEIWNQIHASGYWYRLIWFFRNANSGFDEKHQRYQLVNPWSWVECINFILLEWILRTTNTICMNINAHRHFVWIKYKFHHFSKYYYQLRQIIIWNLIDLIWKFFWGKIIF